MDERAPERYLKRSLILSVQLLDSVRSTNPGKPGKNEIKEGYFTSMVGRRERVLKTGAAATIVCRKLRFCLIRSIALLHFLLSTYSCRQR